MALEEIQSKLGGKWKLDRSENFDEFLKELGMYIYYVISLSLSLSLFLSLSLSLSLLDFL